MEARAAATTGVPFRERIGCSVKEACEATGLKPTKFYELIAVGAIKTKKVNKRRIVLVPSLLKLLDCEDATDKTPEAA
jgi:hypothetical protein